MYAEAEKLWRETLEMQRRMLGQDHPDTVSSMYDVACRAALRGDRKQALDHGWKEADPMAKDDDLRFLRGDPAFEALVARARENASKSK